MSRSADIVPLTAAQRERIDHLRKSGWDIRSIARQVFRGARPDELFDIEATVADWLSENYPGLPVRSDEELARRRKLRRTCQEPAPKPVAAQAAITPRQAAEIYREAAAKRPESKHRTRADAMAAEVAAGATLTAVAHKYDVSVASVSQACTRRGVVPVRSPLKPSGTDAAIDALRRKSFEMRRAEAKRRHAKAELARYHAKKGGA